MATCSPAPSTTIPTADWGSKLTATRRCWKARTPLLLKRGQQEYAFPVRVARVNGSEVGLQLLPLTNQQHIDFVQCTFARADTWALWQDSFPEDKPMESLLDILKLGFRGYRHGGVFAAVGEGGFPRAHFAGGTDSVVCTPTPERAAPTLSADPAMAQQ